MKNTFYKVSYLTLCLFVATPHTLRAEKSGWQFWLGVGAACLGGAAIAASFIDDNPESLIENAEKTWRTENSTYKQIIKRYNQTYSSERMRYLSLIRLSYNEITSSISKLQKAGSQLEKAHSLLSKKMSKIKHKSDYYKIEALENRLQECARLRDRIHQFVFTKLWPIAAGCKCIEIEKTYNKLYQECAFECPIEVYIQQHHGRSIYPYITYNNTLTKSLDRVKQIISDWNKFYTNIHDMMLQKTDYKWYCYLNEQIHSHISHAEQLYIALYNIQAYVIASAQYQAEQYRQEVERMRIENERIQRQQQREINRLKNQVQSLEWEQYTAPAPCPVYVDVSVQI